MQETHVQYIHQYIGVGVPSFDLYRVFSASTSTQVTCRCDDRPGVGASDVVVTIVVIIIDQSSARERNVLQRQRNSELGRSMIS